MFRFHCEGLNGEQVDISVLAVDCHREIPSSPAMTIVCLFALLSGCRSDSGGFFNLLAGTKPMYVEQWLEYLQEQQKIETGPRQNQSAG